MFILELVKCPFSLVPRCLWKGLVDLFLTSHASFESNFVEFLSTLVLAKGRFQPICPAVITFQPHYHSRLVTLDLVIGQILLCETPCLLCPSSWQVPKAREGWLSTECTPVVQPVRNVPTDGAIVSVFKNNARFVQQLIQGEEGRKRTFYRQVCIKILLKKKKKSKSYGKLNHITPCEIQDHSI